MSPRRIPLIQAPTPLHRLDRLSNELDLDLWIKRDDLTGFAFGGNKGRKLEYLMADALDHGADVVVTCGAAQSNFIRQLGAACSLFGLRCVAVVMASPFEPGHELPLGAVSPCPGGANVLLDSLLGVELQWMPDGTWEDLFAGADAEAERLRATGDRVYEAPIGGSSALGAYAFYRAAEELVGAPFDWIVAPASSGSTFVGLSYAFDGSGTRVLGMACDPEPCLRDDFAQLAASLDAVVGRGVRLAADGFGLSYAAVGPGYGSPSDLGRRALSLMARREGIFLDPIYSAKAFGGLLEARERGAISGRVLFWHTGGLPALFAFDSIV